MDICYPIAFTLFYLLYFLKYLLGKLRRFGNGTVSFLLLPFAPTINNWNRLRLWRYLVVDSNTTTPTTTVEDREATSPVAEDAVLVDIADAAADEPVLSEDKPLETV